MKVHTRDGACLVQGCARKAGYWLKVIRARAEWGEKGDILGYCKDDYSARITFSFLLPASIIEVRRLTLKEFPV